MKSRTNSQPYLSAEIEFVLNLFSRHHCSVLIRLIAIYRLIEIMQRLQFSPKPPATQTNWGQSLDLPACCDLKPLRGCTILMVQRLRLYQHIPRSLRHYRGKDTKG